MEYRKFIEKIEWNLVLSIFFEIIAENISFHNNPHAPAEVESPQRFFPRGLGAADGFRFLSGAPKIKGYKILFAKACIK